MSLLLNIMVAKIVRFFPQLWNTTGATCGPRAAYPSEVSGVHPGFSGARFFWFSIGCFEVLSAIVLSLIRFTDSDYPNVCKVATIKSECL